MKIARDLEEKALIIELKRLLGNAVNQKRLTTIFVGLITASNDTATRHNDLLDFTIDIRLSFIKTGQPKIQSNEKE